MMAEDGLGADIAETSRVSQAHRTTQEENNVPLFGDADAPFVAVTSEGDPSLMEEETESNEDADAPFVAVTSEGDPPHSMEEETESNEDADDDRNVDPSFPLRYSLVTNRDIAHDYETSATVQLTALAKKFLPLANDGTEPK
jgi:hypothetical protein